ncbi:MAG: hypothetical protein K8I02_10400, partial [Candidatus Methylomirabilis sp.]|nr:hypothetical protein [Deltaproteobacteria bacterium]
MRGIRFHADGAREPLESLAGVLAALAARRAEMAARPVGDILDLLADFSGRLLRDPATKGLEGAMFLSAWLRRPNLEKMLALNLGDRVEALDGFVAQGRDYLAARPRGLVVMWMAGNVPTLPAFSFVPALLAKNVALVKLADPEPAGMDAI